MVGHTVQDVSGLSAPVFPQVTAVFAHFVVERPRYLQPFKVMAVPRSIESVQAPDMAAPRRVRAVNEATHKTQYLGTVESILAVSPGNPDMVHS